MSLEQGLDVVGKFFCFQAHCLVGEGGRKIGTIQLGTLTKRAVKKVKKAIKKPAKPTAKKKGFAPPLPPTMLQLPEDMRLSISLAEARRVTKVLVLPNDGARNLQLDVDMLF